MIPQQAWAVPALTMETGTRGELIPSTLLARRVVAGICSVQPPLCPVGSRGTVHIAGSPEAATRDVLGTKGGNLGVTVA